MVRRVTNDVISAVEDGFISWETVARACLGYMSEEDVADLVNSKGWAIADEEDFDDDFDDFSDDADDDFDNSIMSRFSSQELEQIDEIGERYKTSLHTGGDRKAEAVHERDTIADELNLAKEEASRVMIAYLGFDPKDLQKDFDEENKVTKQAVIDAVKKYGLTFTEEALKDLDWNVVDYINDSPFDNAGQWMEAIIRDGRESVSGLFEKDDNWKKYFGKDHVEEELGSKEVCPSCGKEFGEDGRCYNSDCAEYDPVSQYFKKNGEEEIEEDALVGNNYDSLDFHGDGVLIGDIQLEYKEVSVVDQFDNEVVVKHTFYAFISPDTVLDFICSETGLNRKELTVGQAQEHIDDLAKNTAGFYDFLREYFKDEATEEAQQDVSANGFN